MGTLGVLALLVLFSQRRFNCAAHLLNKGLHMLNNSEMNRLLYRSGLYYGSQSILRFEVPEEKISWDAEFEEYNPPYYTSPNVIKKQFTDDENVTGINWNQEDNGVNRISHTGEYKIKNGYPLNPSGRTGIRGRGMLSRWGPNVEGALIATRWRRIRSGRPYINKLTKLPVLQVLLIRKLGFSKWNVPITFINSGEKMKLTMKRLFFSQHVMNYTNLIKLGYSKEFIDNVGLEFFKRYTKIFEGYSARPVNTDNAWVETIARQYHDEYGNCVSVFPVNPLPNAMNLFVRWMDISRYNEIKWFQTCAQFLQTAATKLGGHW